jgi:hypothetical protein
MAFYLARRDGWGTDLDGAIRPPPFTWDVPGREACEAGERWGTYFTGSPIVYEDDRG